MIDYLTTTITTHTSKHHPNHSISCASVPSLSITNIESNIEIDSNKDTNHFHFDNDSCVDYQYNQNPRDEFSSSMKSNLLNVFPDVGDNDSKKIILM